MAAIDTLGLAISDVGAAVAAVAAVAGLAYARQTVREARAERIAGEQARLTRRVEWVGEIVEQIDRLAEEDLHMRPMGETWRRGCRLLAQGFIGLDARLPQTARLVQCTDPYGARSIVAVAREEVAAELGRLAREQVPQHEPAHAAADRGSQPQWVAGLGEQWRRRTRRAGTPQQDSNGSAGRAGHQRSQHRLRRDGSRDSSLT